MSEGREEINGKMRYFMPVRGSCGSALGLTDLCITHNVSLKADRHINPEKNWTPARRPG